MNIPAVKRVVTSTTISQSVSMHTATYTALNFTLCTIKCETNLHCTNEQLITELTVCTIKCETNMHCTNKQLITELTVCTIKCETNMHCTNEQLITELTVCTIKCETNLHCTNEQLITELTVWQTLSLAISMSTQRTLTACEVSGRTSRFCGSWSRVTIQRCVNTCWSTMRWCGSMCSILDTRSLAAGDTTSQLPPRSANLPPPMRARICSAESSGPLANGVCLQINKHTHAIFHLNWHQQ